MRIVEKWKGLCRECEEIVICYFDVMQGTICSRCGSHINDAWLEERHLR